MQPIAASAAAGAVQGSQVVGSSLSLLCALPRGNVCPRHGSRKRQVQQQVEQLPNCCRSSHRKSNQGRFSTTTHTSCHHHEQQRLTVLHPLSHTSVARLQLSDLRRFPIWSSSRGPQRLIVRSRSRVAVSRHFSCALRPEQELRLGGQSPCSLGARLWRHRRQQPLLVLPPLLGRAPSPEGCVGGVCQCFHSHSASESGGVKGGEVTSGEETPGEPYKGSLALEDSLQQEASRPHSPPPAPDNSDRSGNQEWHRLQLPWRVPVNWTLPAWQSLFGVPPHPHNPHSPLPFSSLPFLLGGAGQPTPAERYRGRGIRNGVQWKPGDSAPFSSGRALRLRSASGGGGQCEGAGGSPVGDSVSFVTREVACLPEAVGASTAVAMSRSVYGAGSGNGCPTSSSVATDLLAGAGCSASASAAPIVTACELGSAAALHKWLAERLPVSAPLAEWGVRRGTKSVGSLWKELRQGEAWLSGCSGGAARCPVRNVRVVSVRVRRAEDGVGDDIGSGGGARERSLSCTGRNDWVGVEIGDLHLQQQQALHQLQQQGPQPVQQQGLHQLQRLRPQQGPQPAQLQGLQQGQQQGLQQRKQQGQEVEPQQRHVLNDDRKHRQHLQQEQEQPQQQQGMRDRVLVEARQQMADGSTRERRRPLSEKMRPGESVEEASLRGIFEELGPTLGSRDRVQLLAETLRTEVEERDSVSYPGLPCLYVVHTIDAVVRGLPEGPFCTEEDEGHEEEVGEPSEEEQGKKGQGEEGVSAAVRDRVSLGTSARDAQREALWYLAEAELCRCGGQVAGTTLCSVCALRGGGDEGGKGKGEGEGRGEGFRSVSAVAGTVAKGAEAGEATRQRPTGVRLHYWEWVDSL